MLQRLTLEGYRGHENNVVVFDKYLTVITGLNDSGKSSIVNALQWLTTEDVKGADFMLHLKDNDGNTIKEAKITRAILELENGFVIEKYRKKKETGFIVTDPSGEQKSFVTAKTPEEVTKILNFDNSHAFGDFETNLNFHYQLAAPFLMSEAPSVGAVVMGSLSGTEALDLAAGEVEKDSRNAKVEQNRLRAALNDLNTEFLQYAFLDEARATLQKLFEALEITAEADRKTDRLSQLQTGVLTGESKIEKQRLRLSKFVMLPSLQELFERTKDLQKFFKNLQLLKLRKDTHESALQKKTEKLETLQKVLGPLMQSLDVAAIENKRLSSWILLSGKLEVFQAVCRRSKEKLEKLEVLKGFLLPEKEQETLKKLQRLQRMFSRENNLLKIYKDRTTKLNYLGNLSVVSENIDKDYNELHKRLILNLRYRRGAENVENLLKKSEKFEKLKSINTFETFELIGKLHSLLLTRERIEQKKDEVKRREKVTDFLGNSIKFEHEKLDELWQSVGGVCPLCEQPIKK